MKAAKKDQKEEKNESPKMKSFEKKMGFPKQESKETKRQNQMEAQAGLDVEPDMPVPKTKPGLMKSASTLPAPNVPKKKTGGRGLF
jgi:hypothetical protein